MAQLLSCNVPKFSASPLIVEPHLASMSLGFGSSEGCAIADDALKDADNAAWLMFLTRNEQTPWYERIRWIRTIDRLAEDDWLQGDRACFEQFCRHWQHLYQTGNIPINSPYQRELGQMSRAWQLWRGSVVSDPAHESQETIERVDDPFAISAWQRYLQAIADYHHDDLRLATIADYHHMTDRLGGSLFQVLPDLTPDLAVGARALGSLDQCYNHLRDLYEDTQQGLCYFPQDYLAAFGLTAEDFYQLRVFEQPGYRRLMEVWLNDYLPSRVAIAQRLTQDLPLPTSWRLLCDWSFDRYQRIEVCLRRCDYNYVEFADRYWSETRHILKHYADRPVAANYHRYHAS